MAGAALYKRCSVVSYRLQAQHTRSDRTAGVRWPELPCTRSDISNRLQAQHTRSDRTADIITHRTTGAAQYTHCFMSSQVTGPITRADPTLATCRRFIIGYRFLVDVRSVSAPLPSARMVVLPAAKFFTPSCTCGIFAWWSTMRYGSRMEGRSKSPPAGRTLQVVTFVQDIGGPFPDDGSRSGVLR